MLQNIAVGVLVLFGLCGVCLLCEIRFLLIDIRKSVRQVERFKDVEYDERHKGD